MILFIEDESLSRHGFASILRANGYQVAEAENGVEALAKRSADYANAAIAAAEKEARISLRAWVVPAKTQFTQLEIGNVIRIEIQAVNNGRTPAINATTDFQSEVFLKGLPRPIIKPFPVEPEPLGTNCWQSKCPRRDSNSRPQD